MQCVNEYFYKDRNKKLAIWVYSRSVPLRYHYDAFHSNVYRVVEQLSLDSRELLCLIESIHSVVQHADRSQLKSVMAVLQIQMSHPRLIMS